MRISAAALRTAILPVLHLRTPFEGVPQMCISPTPSEGVERWNENAAAGGSRGGGGLVAVVVLRTFGRWNENAGKRLTFGRCGGW